MHIYELEEGESVDVFLKIKNREDLEWKCEIIKTIEKSSCILINPLTYNGKVITSFDADVTAEVVVMRDGIPLVFKPCTIKFIRINDKGYDAIITKIAATKLNRRRHYRVPVDEYCYVKSNRATIDAFIKDVSSGGFGFYVSKWDDATPNEVLLSYKDSDLGRDIMLKGKVVRSVERDGGGKNFGCSMEPREDIDIYINNKQRVMLGSKAGRK